MAGFDSRKRNRLAARMQERSETADGLGIAAFGNSLQQLLDERQVARVSVAPAPAPWLRSRLILHKLSRERVAVELIERALAECVTVAAPEIERTRHHLRDRVFRL